MLILFIFKAYFNIYISDIVQVKSIDHYIIIYTCVNVYSVINAPLNGHNG